MIVLLIGLKEAEMLDFSFPGSYFTTSPGCGGYVVLVAEAMWFWLRRLCVGRLEESKIRLTQPSLPGTGAELGKSALKMGNSFAATAKGPAPATPIGFSASFV